MKTILTTLIKVTLGFAILFVAQPLKIDPIHPPALIKSSLFSSIYDTDK